MCPETEFDFSQLWPKVSSRSETAKASGSLQPIETHLEHLVEAGIPFQIRQLCDTSRKFAPSVAASNPFLSPEADLLVGDLGNHHRAILNKFMVVPQHLLIVTRSFKSQTAPLDMDDFMMASRALASGPGLLFFNAGAAAGASQAHRHLQLVPLPLSASAGGFPLAPRLLSNSLPWIVFSDKTATIPPVQRAHRWYAFYVDVIREFWGMDMNAKCLPPYNILASEEGIFLIPRHRECVAGISINALGYAGLLLVKNVVQREHLYRVGPLDLLKQAAVSR